MQTKEIQIISATRDYIFKAIMLDKEHEQFLKDIINYISNIPMEELEHMIIGNIEHLAQNKKDKKMRSDIIISISKFCINIEMNNDYYNGLFQRNNGYLYLIGAKQYNEDEKYVNTKKVLQINFDNFSHFNKGKEVYKFTMKEEETGVILKEFEEIYHVDMAFIRKKCYNKPVSNLNFLEKACMILTSTSKEELYKYVGDDKILEKVADKIVKLSSDEKMQGLYNIEEEERKIRNSIRYSAKQDGISQGIEQQKLEITKKMLEENTDVNFISRVTGLTLEEINNLN